ncbi:MAG: polysaccharide pyruvyl transferase WcaK-like protein [Rhodothermales bacterium]
MARYIILGTSVYGIENQGDEALLSTLVRDLKAEDPEAHVTWVARHPNPELAASYGCDDVIPGLEHESKEASMGRWFNGLNPGDDASHLTALADRIREADVLVVGGDPFQEISLGLYRGLAPQAALLVTLSRFLGTPIVLYSIHIGSRVLSAHARELTKYCIENAALTTLREQFSQDRLSDYGIGTSTCEVVADSAWGLEPVVDPATRSAVLARNGVVLGGRGVIGFNIRHNYWQWSAETWGRKRAEVCSFLDGLIEQHDMDVLSIPNCTYDVDHEYEDDREVAREIKAQMRHGARFHLIEEKMSLRETMTLFPGLDYHISNRRHSAIFAAVQGVPVLALGGLWHVRPGIDEIGFGMPFLEPEFWTVANLRESFAYVVDNRDAMLARMGEAMPGLRAGARRQAELIAGIARS